MKNQSWIIERFRYLDEQEQDDFLTWVNNIEKDFEDFEDYL